MHFSTLASFCLASASGVLAAPLQPSSRATPGGQNVVHRGQNGGDIGEKNDLAHFCSSTEGIVVVVPAFLYEYRNSQSCSIDTFGNGENCDDLAKAISICQSEGIKVMLSLGGAIGAYWLQSQDEAGDSRPEPLGCLWKGKWQRSSTVWRHLCQLVGL